MPQKLRRFLFAPFLDADSGGGGSAGGTGSAGATGGDQAPKTYTEEYVSALRGESAGYRTKLRSVEQVLGKVKGYFGIKDDPEDWDAVINGHKQTSEKAVSDAMSKSKQLLLKAEIKTHASELGIVDADAAMALADLSKAQVADDGQVTGVKEALEALITAKPYLKKGSGSVGSGSNPGGGNEPPKDPGQMSMAEYIEWRNKK